MTPTRCHIIPETKDDCEIPIGPDPFHLDDVGPVIKSWLDRFKHQGYFSNARQQRLRLEEMTFRLVPAE